MKQVKDIIKYVLNNGVERQTRTGEVISAWNYQASWDIRDDFPAVTSKTLAWKPVVGELLWFLSGSKSLSDLRKLTYGSDQNQWTIWNGDTERWLTNKSYTDKNFVGDLYPTQWRNYNGGGVDQIQNLISNIIENPLERDHIVMAWNPEAIHRDLMALKPCHLGFQCYITNNGELNLHWWQRSVDVFLGLPFNIASYSLLAHLLANWCNLRVGTVSCTLMDVHIYVDHMDSVNKYMSNIEYPMPKLILPKGCETFEDTLNLTAIDFKDCLYQYESAGEIKAPLSVGS